MVKLEKNETVYITHSTEKLLKPMTNREKQTKAANVAAYSSPK